MTRRELLQIAIATVGASGVSGCGAGRPSLTYDVDACAWCRMTISDRRFGAAARSAHGRAARFDSIACLAAWVESQAAAPRALWVTDAMAPGGLVPLSTVRFHLASPGTAPMGRGYVAVTSTRGTTPWDGERLSWAAIRAAVTRDSTRMMTDTASVHRGR